MIKKFIIFLLLLAVVGLGGVYIARNVLVEKGVESGSSYALGVDTDLGSASLNLGGGDLELNDLEVDNPEGFSGEKFLRIDHLVLDVQAGSILDDEVVIDSFVIEGIKLNFEQIDGGGNYRAILDNLQKIDPGSSEDSDQKFRINKVAIRDIQVDAVLSLLGQERYQKSFTVDNITMTNLGGDDGTTIAGITAQVLKAVITKATIAGKGLLPDGFGDLSSLKAEGRKKIENEAASKLKQLGGSLIK